MDKLIIYAFNRFVFRIAEFIRHWYVDFFKFYSHKVISFLERLDRVFALKITLEHWLEPLYQDRTISGYIFGFIFRTLRIVIGASIYFCIIFAAVVVYLIWAAVPLFLVLKAVNHNKLL